MAYEMVMPYHLHMPSYFLETFTEYPVFEHLLFKHPSPTRQNPISRNPIVKDQVRYPFRF